MKSFLSSIARRLIPAACLFLVPLAACTAQNDENPAGTPGPDGAVHQRWNFDTIKGWVYEHQDTASVSQCSLADGYLIIYTRALTLDRQKMHTYHSHYTAGRYAWRTYISPIATGERASIGSWIYSDDHHELDFEVGPGTAEVRRKYGIREGEMAACMTSQDFPFISEYTAVKPGWHDFAIELTDVGGKYLARWSVDGEVKQTVQLQYGPEVGFRIYCSVENLNFIGDKQAENNNYGMWDYVTFDGQVRK